MAHIDHIVVAVRDPEKYTAHLLSQFGLASYHGGRLAGIGTESHIVPLGEGYLDLVSIADEREANSNPLGRAVLIATEEREAKIITWAVNPGHDIQLRADQLDLPTNPLKRALPDGGHAACRVVGLQQLQLNAERSIEDDQHNMQAVEGPPLPYFVEWASKEERPDQVFVDHISDPMGFAWVEVSGERNRLQAWLGESMVPLQFVNSPSPACVEAFGILTEGEAIIIRSPLETGTTTPTALSSPVPAASPAERFQSPHKTEQNLSTFAIVLDSIEQAIETAAVAVETMAGGVTSPEDLKSESENENERE